MTAVAARFGTDVARSGAGFRLVRDYEALNPVMLIDRVRDDLKAIRFIHEAGEKARGLDPAASRYVAGVDAYELCIVACLFIAQRIPSSSRCCGQPVIVFGRTLCGLRRCDPGL